MELQMHESSTSFLPPRTQNAMFYGKEKPRNPLPSQAFPQGTLGLRAHHARGVSSSVIVTSSDKNNLANPRSPLFQGIIKRGGGPLQDDDNYDEQIGHKVGVTTQVNTTRLMHNSFTQNRPNAGILNAKLLSHAVNQRLDPISLVRAAAARVKESDCLKREQISRLELQKETLKHMHEHNANQVMVIDGPRRNDQVEDRGMFMSKGSNIKNNIVAQNYEEDLEMSLQPNKFNAVGWEYKKMSDIKLRSNLVADHLNGKYCQRDLPKKDVDRYKPSKIFKTMYQKTHTEQSRNLMTAGGANEEPQTVEYGNKNGSSTQDKYLTQKKNIQSNISDLLYRSQMGEHDREQLSPYPKNDYAPPFVTSLNFNFNMNDVFGSTKKPPNPKMLQGGLAENRSLHDMLGNMKNSMEQRKIALIGSGSFMGGNAKSASRSTQPGKFETVQPASSTSLNAMLASQPLKMMSNGLSQQDEQAEQMTQMRRQLNSQVLKNQYSYWAGMLVKRIPNKNDRLSVEEALLKSKKNREKIDSILTPLVGQPNQPMGFDTRNFYDYRSNSTSGGPVVDFGDPRSLTQGISFNRKRGPYLPEQEMKIGGSTKPLPPPFLRGVMPPKIPAPKKK